MQAIGVSDRRYGASVCTQTTGVSDRQEITSLRENAVKDTRLDFKLVKATGHGNTVHGKFLIVLDFLVTTTSTDTLAPTGTLDLQPLSNNSLVK